MILSTFLSVLAPLFISLCFLVTGTLLSCSAQAERWATLNDPAQLDLQKNYQYNFAKLPLESSLKLIPWSETYWPTNKGSMNLRWNTITRDVLNDTPFNKAVLLKLI